MARLGGRHHRFLAGNGREAQDLSQAPPPRCAPRRRGAGRRDDARHRRRGRPYHRVVYPYFGSKEAIYAAVLGESLDALEAAVSAQMAAVSDPGERAVAGLRGFFEYYRARPDDLSLGLYLFNGLGRRGLNRDLDAVLNTKLWCSFDPIQAAFAAAGRQDPAAATAGAIGQAIGLLVMEQTGRLDRFERAADDVFQNCLNAMLQP